MPRKPKQAVIVDAKDNILMCKDVVKTHKNPVLLHRAVSIVIFDKTGKNMLIQKRSGNKKTWPFYWTNTVCTNVLPNETYKGAAARRLKEEMGIVTKLEEVFSFIYKAKYDDVWGECELDHVFVGKYEGKIIADSREVAGYQWIDLAELKRDVKVNSQNYTPWFKIILKKLEV